MPEFKEPDRADRAGTMSQYPPQVMVPEMRNASLLTVLQTIQDGFLELFGGDDQANEVMAKLTFADFMGIYAMLPHYRDVVIAIEEYLFAKQEF